MWGEGGEFHLCHRVGRRRFPQAHDIAYCRSVRGASDSALRPSVAAKCLANNARLKGSERKNVWILSREKRRDHRCLRITNVRKEGRKESIIFGDPLLAGFRNVRGFSLNSLANLTL